MRLQHVYKISLSTYRLGMMDFNKGQRRGRKLGLYEAINHDTMRTNSRQLGDRDHTRAEIVRDSHFLVRMTWTDIQVALEVLLARVAGVLTDISIIIPVQRERLRDGQGLRVQHRRPRRRLRHGLRPPLRVAALPVVHIITRQRPPRTAPAAWMHAVAAGLARCITVQNKSALIYTQQKMEEENAPRQKLHATIFELNPFCRPLLDAAEEVRRRCGPGACMSIAVRMGII